MPDVLYQFFRSNFSLTDFSQNNQILIREKYINQFFENEDELTLAGYINDTISFDSRIKIDTHFPRVKLVRIFKPYIRLYLDVNYSLDSNVRWMAKCILIDKLHQFHTYNPIFGRRIYKMNPQNKKISQRPTFNDDHIEFNNPCSQIKQPFLSSHITSVDNHIQYTRIHISDEDEDEDEDENENEDEDEDEDEDENEDENEFIAEENAADMITEEDRSISSEELNPDTIEDESGYDDFRILASNVYSDETLHCDDLFVQSDIQYFEMNEEDEEDDTYDP
jgi:hypothetical protein